MPNIPEKISNMLFGTPEDKENKADAQRREIELEDNTPFSQPPIGPEIVPDEDNSAQQQLLSKILFSETKDPEDARAIAHVIQNRTARPKRFGETLEDVIYAPSQFSGVNTSEWKKAETGNLTAEEQKIYDELTQISSEVLSGESKDPTGGADHYYNPKLASPSWGKKYPKVYSTSSHDYFKEK